MKGTAHPYPTQCELVGLGARELHLGIDALSFLETRIDRCRVTSKAWQAGHQHALNAPPKAMG